MPATVSQIVREVIHAPRRMMYAFLWAALPPEDVDNDTAGATPAAPPTA